MRPTSFSTQEAVLFSMFSQRQQTQVSSSGSAGPPISIATYKAHSLEPGSQYPVYVSYVTDGPCNFSVQLQQSEEILCKLMKDINSMPLTPLEGIPIPGTVCLARCIEDGHMCRAVVTNEVDGLFKVFFVDFGNFETLPLEALYEIPFKCIIPKVMALRFSLAGVEKSTVTLEMQCAFKQFVDNRLMHMKVMPMTTRTALPKCELWDPDTNTTALDIVNQAALASYPDYVSLNRGFCQPIKVSYVFSCSRFFVQLKSKEDELNRLMVDIQNICKDSDVLSFDVIRPGLPCYALFEGDGQWYRSQIVELNPDATVKVHYVDYGNEEVVSLKALKPIEGKQLTVLRPQAIECSLNGYQNMAVDEERDALLEQIILEQEFTMKVVDMQGGKALIELIDAENYNVASRLLEKLASARSQASPMLVQADNTIELKKTKDQQPAPYRNDQRKLERNEQNQWDNNTNSNDTSPSWRQQGNKERSNKRNSRDNIETNSNEINDSNTWRQDNKSTNNFSRNDSNDGDSWQQNKSGFNRNQDRNKSDYQSKDDGGGGDSWGQNKYSDRNRDRQSDRPDRRDNRNGHWESDRDRNKSDDWNSGVGNRRETNRNNDDWNGGNDRKPREFNRNDGRKPREFNRNDDRKKDWGGGGDRRNNRNFDNNSDNKEESWEAGSGAGSERKSFSPKEGGKTFNKRDRYNNESEPWNNDSKPSGGFRKKNDFRRDGSERSYSSGSEKGFQKGGGGFNKGPRNNDRFGGDRKFDNKRNTYNSTEETWNDANASVSAEIPNAAPSTAKYATQILDGTDWNVCISWFHNPSHFYCQLNNSKDKFKQMMTDIQEAYKNRLPTDVEVGAPVVGLFPEDGVLYRAVVSAKIDSKYQVQYVDFGNVSLISKVWPIEMRFMDLPVQAICCGMEDLEPLSETWPEASSYSKYFENKEFTCRFISTLNERTTVQLFHENEDISQMMVRDGIAKALVVAAPIPAELPMMIGQQFRAMLLSVNSLSDFLISLHTGQPVTCSIFNVENSTETWEDALKEQLNNILIVYVDNVVEDRLHVTLYDSKGYKIKLIDQDEEAFETVELICAYPVLNSNLYGYVAHVDGPTIYIQPTESAQAIDYLVNGLFEYFDSFELSTPIVPVESFVYAVKSSDGNWYRGRVTSLEEDNKVVVNFIDYGNSETVELTALKELLKEHMEVPIQCVPVVLTVPTDDLLDKDISLVVFYTDNGLEGTIQEEFVKDEAVAVDVAPVAESAPYPQEAEVQTTETQEIQQPEAEKVLYTESEQTYPGNTFVIMSHTDSPSDFYLQLASSGDAIDELQAKLQEEVANMPDLENPTVGVLCAAPYSVDQQWYRALVLDVDSDVSDITTVRFVDYGNTDVLENKVTHVKTLPSELLSLEVHATRCRLKIKPIEEEWSSAATERFQELTLSDQLTVQFLQQDEKTNYVELFFNGQNVRETLIAEGLAMNDEVATENINNGNIGFVSHINSPSEFWVQLENCVDELEWIVEQLSGAEELPELEELAPGTLCAALFPDDQQWYRARILSNTVAGLEVLFIDYGNSCASCNLRELREDLVMMPPLAQKCSLQRPEGLQAWSVDMSRKFVELAADGQTTFTVRKLTTGETATVELLLDGQDVAQILLPTVEDVTVETCQALDDLVLVRNEVKDVNKYKLQALPDVEWNEESHQKFNQLNNGGKTVFQAEFIGENSVRLYLNFNDIRNELGGTKKTPSVTSSPLKSRTTDYSKHSSQSTNEDFENISVVQPILDEVIDGVSQEFVNEIKIGDVSDDVIQPILDEVIDNASQEIENKSMVGDLGDLDEVIDGASQEVESKTKVGDIGDEVIQPILDEVIDGASGEIESKSLVGDVGDNVIQPILDEVIDGASREIESKSMVGDVDDDVIQPILDEVIESVSLKSEEEAKIEVDDAAIEHDVTKIVKASEVIREGQKKTDIELSGDAIKKCSVNDKSKIKSVFDVNAAKDVKEKSVKDAGIDEVAMSDNQGNIGGDGIDESDECIIRESVGDGKTNEAVEISGKETSTEKTSDLEDISTKKAKSEISHENVSSVKLIDKLSDCDEKDSIVKKSDDENTKDSRPASAGSGKLSHDERVVSAAWSRPHSPEPDEDEITTS